MSEEEIFYDIQSVFKGPMKGNDCFQFDVLKSAGGTSKSLVVPSLLSSYQWTVSAIAPKNTNLYPCEGATEGEIFYTIVLVVELIINCYSSIQTVVIGFRLW